jgi:hypothetical protein
LSQGHKWPPSLQEHFWGCSRSGRPFTDTELKLWRERHEKGIFNVLADDHFFIACA